MNSVERKKQVEGIRKFLSEVHAETQAGKMREQTATFLLSEIDRRDEVLKLVARIDIDFIPKGDTFRDVVLKAREVSGEQ